MPNRGKLYLIPNVISEGTQNDVISPQIRSILPSVRFFLAEDVRTARRFLASLNIYESVEPLQFLVLNKNTPETELPGLLQPLHEGKNMGVISESGCPGVADPGSMAVYFAHQNKIEVVPLVGPSSLLLALMGAGLNGQQFAFHGYLPIKAKEAAHLIKELERESKTKSQTQIFIETPYRNNSIFDLLIKNLQPETRLSVALDLTGKQESIRTQSVKKWQSVKIIWPKEPAVFLFLA